MIEKLKQFEKGNTDQSEDPQLNFRQPRVNIQRTHTRRLSDLKNLMFLNRSGPPSAQVNG